MESRDGLRWWSNYFLPSLTSIACRADEEGLKTVRAILNVFKTEHVKIKPSKCRLFQTEARILSFVVSEGQIKWSPQRAEVMEFPKTVRELHSLIGFVNFSRNFNLNLSDLLSPLTWCLRRGQRLARIAETLFVFEQINRLMSTDPVWNMFNPNLECVLKADASDVALVCCLKQIAGRVVKCHRGATFPGGG